VAKYISLKSYSNLGAKYMKSKIVLVLGICLMLLSSFVVMVSAAGPNYMGFATSSQHLVIGASPFTTTIWVDVNQNIDTASVDNLTFLPAGILNFSGLTQGSLMNHFLWIDPYDTGMGGVIDNESGYAKPITDAGSVDVNNTNGTLATVTWSINGCGMVTLNISEGGTAHLGGDPGTTKYPMVFYIHPQAITGFASNKYNTTQINLSWVKHIGDDKTLIRWRSDAYPTSVTNGTLLYNNTGTSTIQTGLSSGDTRYYSAWGWNSTGNIYSYTYVSDVSETNSPPVFGTPSPVNGSTGRNPAFTWSIPITDPDGDLLTAWSIECENGQSNSGSGAGGTKSLALTGLPYSTEQKVWVNASDATDTTSEWFNFTTKANVAPTQGTPSPTNGSTGRPQSFSWSIALTDPDETISWTIECSNGQQTTGTNTASGTKTLSLTGLERLTNYTVRVNLTDGIAWSREWYTFETADNVAPSLPSNPVPTDNDTDVAPDIGYLRIRVTDTDGDALNVSFYWGNDTLIGNVTGVVSGQYAQLSIPDFLENTGYDWYVNVSDGYGGVTRGPATGNYSFTTGEFSEGGVGGEGGTIAGKNKVLFLILFNELPVDKAIITIKKGTSVQTAGVQVSIATTGADGIYQFSLSDGDYIISVNAPGKTLYQEAVSIHNDASYVVHLDSAAAPAGPGATVYVVGALFVALLLLGFLFATGRLGRKKY
jgi:hypothetical protein